MKKHKHLVPYYEQSENCECGLCSLAMIFSYYYCEYSINELRELYPVGRDGLNLFIIKNIAEDKGFDTKAFRVNSSYDILFPSIINIDRVHFVVAEKKTRKGIKIVDPQKGRYEISEEEILHKNMTIGLQIVGTEYSEKRKIVVSKKIFDDIKTNMPLIVKSVFVTVLLQTISLLVPICVYCKIFVCSKSYIQLENIITNIFCNDVASYYSKYYKGKITCSVASKD